MRGRGLRGLGFRNLGFRVWGVAFRDVGLWEQYLGFAKGTCTPKNPMYCSSETYCFCSGLGVRLKMLFESDFAQNLARETLAHIPSPTFLTEETSSC